MPPSPTVVSGLRSAFYTCILLSGFLAADYSGFKWSLAESSSGEWLFVVVVWNNGVWLSSVLPLVPLGSSLFGVSWG